MSKVTDNVVLSHMAAQGLLPDEVEFVQDYAPRGSAPGASPYSKLYASLKDDRKILVSSGLPMVDYLGRKVDPGWVSEAGGYRAKPNIFAAFARVDGQITVECLNDQPDGRKSGQIARWQPALYLNGRELGYGNLRLLEVDPVNPGYTRNVLEWDYGICRRRLRLIEGKVLGRWVFPVDPNGDVRLIYNQTGDFPVRLSEYAVSPDEEFISREQFAAAEYPLEIGDTLTAYPDWHPETNTVDGYVGRYYNGSTWSSLVTGAGTVAGSDSSTIFGIYIQSGSSSNTWNEIRRGIYLFDTSGLGAAAVISAATLSLCGGSKTDGQPISPNINIYSSNPASNTDLVAGDYGILGGTAFSTAIEYVNWSINAVTPVPNNFAFNASGLAAISKTGITKLGTRNGNYDVPNSAPVWGGGAYTSSISVFTAENGGNWRPKLVVTYIIPKPRSWGFIIT